MVDAPAGHAVAPAGGVVGGLASSSGRTVMQVEATPPPAPPPALDESDVLKWLIWPFSGSALVAWAISVALPMRL
jgi:hypothetical protein